MQTDLSATTGSRTWRYVRLAVALAIAMLVAGQSSGLVRVNSLQYRGLFVGLAFFLLFSGVFGLGGRYRSLRNAALGAIVLLLIPATLYTVLNSVRLMSALEEPTTLDRLMGIFFLLLSLEAGRRQIGISFVGIVVAALAYLILGPHLPGVLANSGMGFFEAIDRLYMGTNGMWGNLTGIVTLLVAMYIIFGQVMLRAGASEFFIQFAQAAAGRTRAGPASATLIISGVFGMLSGSSAANAATFGTFTIPMMRRSGYSKEQAASVEAVASTGGQIMPPVMGAGAFIMAEFLGMSYTEIIVAAVVPALLYYFGAWAYMDARAGVLGGRRMDTDLTVGRVVRREWRSMLKLITAFGVLSYLLLTGKSPQYAAFWTTVAVLVVVALLEWRKPSDPWRTVIQVKDAIMAAVPSLTDVAALGVCSQIIVFMIGITGLAPKLTNLVLDMSGGHLVVGLLFTALVTTVLGMGVATTADYVLVAAALAPALEAMGAPPLAAQLFIFYFACSSSLTPPVCASVFVASSIAGSRIWGTGGRACVMAISAFIVPFIFVYRPELLLIGEPLGVALAIAAIALGVYAISAGLGGAMLRKLGLLERALLVVASLLLWQVEPWMGLAGLAAFLAIASTQFLRATKAPVPVAPVE